jgi:hypothetical protein
VGGQRGIRASSGIAQAGVNSLVPFAGRAQLPIAQHGIPARSPATRLGGCTGAGTRRHHTQCGLIEGVAREKVADGARARPENSCSLLR